MELSENLERQASRHVREARVRVLKQRAIVRNHKAGTNAALAKELLITLLTSLAVMLDHRNRIIDARSEESREHT